MPTVDFVFALDCPNVADARARLIHALAEAGVTPAWHEWRIGDPDLPQRVSGYGSPTILVDGTDVAGAEPADAQTCRVYTRPDGSISGLPTVEQIIAAINGPSQRRWSAQLAALPGIGTAMLPKLACPACWPAYAGLVSSLGLGFLLETRWLLPLTVVLLALTVAALTYGAQARRGYGPAVLAATAAVTIIAAKFAFDVDAAFYAGVAVLLSAAIWNAWPRRKRVVDCPACHCAGSRFT
jgi:hypothetical protein